MRLPTDQRKRDEFNLFKFFVHSILVKQLLEEPVFLKLKNIIAADFVTT
jgi:hypothetical protein